ncbi:hypothetical protein NSMM_330019 [Nitrosomonas mobilis]|uniref:Uncharacterized protein n=1 Tax=Nitrosomonas mobilis TaxID=51642 RepID=A0A1G5SF03_9PROT|nr:hypothetical protein NSMM_330019 [Nitrosomonas mobilis]
MRVSAYVDWSRNRCNAQASALISTDLSVQSPGYCDIPQPVATEVFPDEHCYQVLIGLWMLRMMFS